MILIILLCIILIMFFIISMQRNLAFLDENVNNAMSQIGVNLTSRFDALTSLLDIVKGYNEHEYKTLTDVINMRTSIGRNSKAKDVEMQENIITESLGKIMAVAENYPDLKSNQNYNNLMNSLNDYESKVRKSRIVYNDAVTKLNRTIRMFPYMIFKSMFGISERDYLKINEEKENMPILK